MTRLSSLFAAERERFILWVPVLLGTGIGIYFGLLQEPPIWSGALVAVIFGCMAWFGRRLASLRLLALAFALAGVGFLCAGVRTLLVDAPALHKTLYSRTIEGRIDDIQQKNEGLKLFLSAVSIEGVKPHTTPHAVTVTLKQAAPGIKVGDHIRANAILFPPPTPVLPHGYDFARAYYFDGIGAVGHVPGTVAVTESAEPGSFVPWLNSLRLSIAARLNAAMSPDNAAVASAMMVGEMSQVSDKVKDAMRDSGIYHVLSISGLHMSLAAGLVYALARFLLCLHMPLAQRLPVKKIAACIGLLGAFSYLLLAGYPVPAVRSFMMVACVMVAVLFDRRGVSLYSLAWAACLILVFYPESLFGASFQLSFAATLAVVALYERYGHVLTGGGKALSHRIGIYFFALMLSSLAATLATTPLVVYHFNRVTLWGIAANMLLLPLTSFWIMSAAVVSFIAMPFGLEAWPLAVLDMGIGLMISGAKWFASLPLSTFPLPSPSFWGMVLAVYGGLWLCLWRQRWRLLGVPLVIIGTATIALHRPYDLLISDDASKVAIRLQQTNEYLFLRGTDTSFDAKAWLSSEGRDGALTLGDVKFSSLDPRCTKEVCSLQAYGKNIVVRRSKNRGELIDLCEYKADILITPDDFDDNTCVPMPMRFDRKFLDSQGATGLRFENGQVQVETARQHRGRRPWVSIPYSELYQSGNRDMMPHQTEKTGAQ